MKRAVLILTFILSGVIWSQTEDMIKMYERLTGKDISKEIDAFRAQSPGAAGHQTITEGDTLRFSQPVKQIEKASADSIADNTYFEKYVKGMLIDPYKSELRQFRIDLSSVRTSLNYNRQVPDNYMLNAGDIIVIDIWGAMERNYTLEVTNENFIVVPQIGKIDLSGLNYKKAKQAVETRLSRINGISFSVRLGEVKPVTVFIVGNVISPGVYNVSPFSSMIELLAVAGGVRSDGSLRRIKLISQNNDKKEIDLYSLLFFGNNQVAILESNMTVFVPVIEKQVAVAGNVKQEGIYEVLAGERLADILKIAGTTPFSDVSRIEIERLDVSGRKKVLSVNANENPSMNDGDILRIFSTLVFNPSYIYLKGNFRHNKKIQFKDGMKLGDVFAVNEIIHDNTDLNYGSIIRKSGLGKRDIMINFSPGGVIEKTGDDKIALFSRDTIEVFNLDSISFFPSVEISGEINRPGIYRHTKDMTAENLLSYSGGPNANGDTDNILIIRNKGREGFKYFAGIDINEFRLESDDKVHIFDFAARNPVHNVGIWGHIRNEGQYVHSKDMTVYELIRLAGGFMNDAISDSVEVVFGINDMNKELRSRWVSGPDIKKVKLSPNDMVFIRRVRDYGKVSNVKITGEVKYPGMYALREDEKLSDIIIKAGGFTDNAHIRSLQLFRKEVKLRQDAKINELRQELHNKIQLRMSITGNYNLAEGLNISKFDSLGSPGKLVIPMKEEKLHYDLFLHDRDSIHVPVRSGTVYVMGEVFRETAINYDSRRKKVRDYVKSAGGMTPFADKKNIYVIKPNGELMNRRGWFTSSLSLDVESGDVIYIPYNYDRVSFLDLTKDITTILYQLSLSAASVYQISK